MIDYFDQNKDNYVSYAEIIEYLRNNDRKTPITSSDTILEDNFMKYAGDDALMSYEEYLKNDFAPSHVEPM